MAKTAKANGKSKKLSESQARETMMSSSETFAGTLGNVTWLMSMSPEHKSHPVSHLEQTVFPALLTKQFKLYFKGNQPVAFIAFAMVSGELKDKWQKDHIVPELADWRSGNNIIIIECVSPFSEKQAVMDEFIASVPKAELNIASENQSN